jgi:hypothetical protein
VVSAPVTPTGLTQPSLQSALGGKNQQSLAIGVQPPHRVNFWSGDEFREGAPATSRLRGELAKHPIGLVEQEGCQGSLRGGLGPLE